MNTQTFCFSCACILQGIKNGNCVRLVSCLAPPKPPLELLVHGSIMLWTTVFPQKQALLPGGQSHLCRDVGKEESHFLGLVLPLFILLGVSQAASLSPRGKQQPFLSFTFACIPSEAEVFSALLFQLLPLHNFQNPPLALAQQ